MRKFVLFAALVASVMPSVKAQDTTDEGEVKSFYVGEFENPGDKEVMWGSGSFYERAPFQFYNIFSGLQVIYPAEYLTPLLDDNGAITEIVFKMGDEGTLDYIESDLTVYIQNIEESEFTLRDHEIDYRWFTISPDASCSKVRAELELYYMEDIEFHFVFDKPLKYEGKNLLVTAWSNRITEDDPMPYLITYAMPTYTRNIMFMGDDHTSFEDSYATGYQFPNQSPAKNGYVPVTKFMYTVDSGVQSVVADANDVAPRYYNLQGQPVSGKLAPGIYICRQGSEAKKVIIR